MTLVKTSRDSIIERYQGRERLFPYFFYEEDPYECEYSKFVTDELYDDDQVDWNYIVDDNKIVGICALSVKDNARWINFIEIAKSQQGQGYGTEAVNYIIDTADENTIRLFPKDDETGTEFYKKILGFKWLDKEMYYMKYGK